MAGTEATGTQALIPEAIGTPAETAGTPPGVPAAPLPSPLPGLVGRHHQRTHLHAPFHPGMMMHPPPHFMPPPGVVPRAIPPGIVMHLRPGLSPPPGLIRPPPGFMRPPLGGFRPGIASGGPRVATVMAQYGAVTPITSSVVSTIQPNMSQATEFVTAQDQAGSKAGEGEQGLEEQCEQMEQEETEEERAHKIAIARFREMLVDKGIKPFSNFDKELPKMVHDKRFKLIKSLPERKRVFKEFVTTFAEVQRKEKVAKRKATLEIYKAAVDQKKEVIEDMILSLPDISSSECWKATSKCFAIEDWWQKAEGKEKEKYFHDVFGEFRKGEEERRQIIKKQEVGAIRTWLAQSSTVTFESEWDQLKDTMPPFIVQGTTETLTNEERKRAVIEFLEELAAKEREERQIRITKRRQQDEEERQKENLKRRREEDEAAMWIGLKGQPPEKRDREGRDKDKDKQHKATKEVGLDANKDGEGNSDCDAEEGHNERDRRKTTKSWERPMHRGVDKGRDQDHRRDKDKDRHRDKDKGRERGRDRDRDWERQKDWDKDRDRSRTTGGGKHRDADRDRGKDKGGDQGGGRDKRK